MTSNFTSAQLALIEEISRNASLLVTADATAFSDADINTFFLLVCAIFVFSMQVGFTFLEAGCVRVKSVVNICAKNLLDAVIGAVAYWAIGYAFSFGGNNPFIGHKYFFLIGAPASDYAIFFFEFVFAATASTIVSGSVAERCHFIAYVGYSVVITGIVYPVAVHWVWGKGWLSSEHRDTPMMDFAGSCVVHVIGGSAGLCAAIFLGPRIGRFDSDGKVNSMPGHSLLLSSVGALVLWCGFFAFNGGSELAIAGPGHAETVGRAIVNTALAAAGGSSTALLYGRFISSETRGKWSVFGVINGMLAGAVSVCAGANVYQPWAAFVVGCVSGVVYFGWRALLFRLKIDDPCDAVPVHLGAGLWGTLAAPLFASESGVLYAWDGDAFEQFGTNVLGLIAVLAWTMAVTSLLFLSLRLAGAMRVSEEEEAQGIDISKHGESAYPHIDALEELVAIVVRNGESKCVQVCVCRSLQVPPTTPQLHAICEPANNKTDVIG